MLNFNDPASTFILALLETVIAPAISFAPLKLLITPSLFIPVPKTVMGLLTRATPPSICMALPLFMVTIPVVPNTLVFEDKVGLTSKRLLFAATVIGPVNPVLFPFNVNILAAPVPSFVMVPLPDNEPEIVIAPIPPNATDILVPVAIDVALLKVNKVASEFILAPEVTIVIVPDKVLPALVLGTLILPVAFIPVPFKEKYSCIVALLTSTFTAAPAAIEV